MGMILQSAIDIARGVLNDTTATYRYSDPDLLEYGNGALRALAKVKPELLFTEGDLTCEVGKAMQSVSFDDAYSLVNIIRIKGGNVVLPCDKAALDEFNPGWMGATAGPAINWMANGNDPVRFFITPPAPANQILEVLYVRNPGPFTAGDDTGLPNSIVDAVAGYIVGMAESRDDEAVNSNRAAMFLAKFVADLKG